MASGRIAWNPETAAHLLRRAGFGGTPADAADLEARGLEGAVAHLLSEPPEGAPPPATDPGEQETRRRLREARKSNGEEARVAAAEYDRAQRQIFDDMRFWWLGEMHSAAHSVREKLVLFWHGHFATSQTKVRFNHLMLGQNRKLRQLALASFEELCAAMARDPAMLIWLDGKQSHAKSPNENFAREVMELFTLGEGHYSEADVREAARAFTGWVVRQNDGSAELVARRHDSGEKTILGRSGRFSADEAAAILCGQPQCAEFLAAKLWEFYAYAEPSPELVKSLAEDYRAKKLVTRDFLAGVFTRPEFYSAPAVASQIKSPVQWLVQASRELGRQLLPPGLILPLATDLGQNLFMPPSVKGWDGGTAWINSGTLIRRSNTAHLFAVAAPPLPVEGVESMNAVAWARVAPAADRADAERLRKRLERVFLAAPATPATRRKLDAILAGRDFPCDDATVREASVVLLACPEYQLC